VRSNFCLAISALFPTLPCGTRPATFTRCGTAACTPDKKALPAFQDRASDRPGHPGGTAAPITPGFAVQGPPPTNPCDSDRCDLKAPAPERRTPHAACRTRRITASDRGSRAGVRMTGRSTLPATSIAAGGGESEIIDPRARRSAASCMASPARPTSRLARRLEGAVLHPRDQRSARSS
jgi:hypothetical protein